MFRNNGQYTFMVLLLFMALVAVFGREGKRWRKLFLLSLAGFLSGILMLNLLFRATGAEQGDRREMLSMPSAVSQSYGLSRRYRCSFRG